MNKIKILGKEFEVGEMVQVENRLPEHFCVGYIKKIPKSGPKLLKSLLLSVDYYETDHTTYKVIPEIHIIKIKKLKFKTP